MTQNKPFIIGLSGLSGSGKGKAGETLASLGCLVIDCDKLAHENMKKGNIAYDGIVNAFGSGILCPDGEIDRKSLAAVVFADKAKLRLLNRLTHSYIKQRISEIIDTNTKYDCIVIDAPLLAEAGLMELCGSLWLVEADEKTRLERVMRRDMIDEKKAVERFKNQRDFSDIYDRFDVHIKNNTNDSRLLEEEVCSRFNELRLKHGF